MSGGVYGGGEYLTRTNAASVDPMWCAVIRVIKYFTCTFSDEVGALVFDFGAHSCRAGFAGEDTPKV